MKVKVSFFNPKLLKNYFEFLSIISVLSSFLLIVITIPNNLKFCVGISLLLFFLLIYFIMWLLANLKSKRKLNINNSTLIVKLGDIFKEEGLKVISFNEYFDIDVDNRIIAESSLNGVYLKTKVLNLDKFENKLNTDIHLKECIIEQNVNRTKGRKVKYKLGTIFQNDDFLLTAFSKFDENDRAYLYMKDYVDFLLNFWNEIDIIYAGRSVTLPLLGSGLTRFKENVNITEQELLELIIWSFKVSKIKFTYPSKITILISDRIKNKINFYKLNE